MGPPHTELLTLMVTASDAEPRAISSMTRAAVTLSSPAPPYSSGIVMPSSPNSARRAMARSGNSSARSSAPAVGRTSDATNSRTVSRMRRCSSLNWRSILRSVLEEAAGDDEPLDFGRAFVNFGNLGVAEVPLNGIIVHVSVSAENLHSLDGRAHGHLGGEELRLGGLPRVTRSPILQPGRPMGEQPRGVDLCGHVGQHELNGLEFADALAECLPLAGVSRRFLQRRSGNSNGLRCDPDSPAIQGVH